MKYWLKHICLSSSSEYNPCSWYCWKININWFSGRNRQAIKRWIKLVSINCDEISLGKQNEKILSHSNIQPCINRDFLFSFIRNCLPSSDSTEYLDLLEELYWFTKLYMSGKDPNTKTSNLTGVWQRKWEAQSI